MTKNSMNNREIINFGQSEAVLCYNNDKTIGYPSHWHTPFELIMPTHGTYQVKCNNHQYHLATDDILIICPGILHELIAPAFGERIILQVSVQSIQTAKDISAITAMLTPVFHLSALQFPRLHKEVHKQMLNIKQAYFEQPPFYTLKIYTTFLKIMTLLGENHIKNIQRIYTNDLGQREYMEKFISICNYITEHCTEELSLEHVAALAGFSKYHFSRLFKEFTDISFYRYLTLKRINHAQMLLCNPLISITETSLQSGFPSVTSFIRMFKLINNCTPTEFRKMHREGLLL